MISSNPLVSFVIGTYNRRDELRETIYSVLKQEYEPLEIVIVSNSNDGTRNMFQNGGEFADKSEIRFFHRDERMGVTKARNFGYEKSEGDIIITIDDDVIITDESSIDQIVKTFQEPDVGVVALKVVNYYSGEVEYPFSGDLESKIPFIKPPHEVDLTSKYPIDTTLYLGAGNAKRASMLTETGTYPPEFFYGSEEWDFSYRVIDSGYRIVYLPTVSIKHKRSPKGRIPDKEDLQRRLENKIRVGIRNLPWKYAALTAILWTGRTVYRGGLDPRPLFWAWLTIVTEFTKLLDERDVINDQAIKRIRDLDGRLY